MVATVAGAIVEVRVLSFSPRFELFPPASLAEPLIAPATDKGGHGEGERSTGSQDI